MGSHVLKRIELIEEEIDGGKYNVITEDSYDNNGNCTQVKVIKLQGTKIKKCGNGYHIDHDVNSKNHYDMTKDEFYIPLGSTLYDKVKNII